MSEVNQWEAICASSDLSPNIGVRALVGQKQIAIFKVKDAVYAIDAIDPFTKMAVLSRGIIGDLDGQIVVASPIYKQHFNLQSGACLEDEGVKVETYAIRDNNGKIEISLS